jgi:hypothetical protein
VAKPPDVALYAGMDVKQTLLKLKDRMYVIGEVDPVLGDWDAAVAGAALHITERMTDESKHTELTTNVTEGSSPLAFAAMNGYPGWSRPCSRFPWCSDRSKSPGPRA